MREPHKKDILSIWVGELWELNLAGVMTMAGSRVAPGKDKTNNNEREISST